MNLPAELRNRIYEEALGFRNIRFIKRTLVYSDQKKLAEPEESYKRVPHMLALMRVCRQIHLETALLPYKLNTFMLHKTDYWTAEAFLLCRTPNQVRAMQSVVNTPSRWFDHASDDVKEMTALEHMEFVAAAYGCAVTNDDDGGQGYFERTAADRAEWNQWFRRAYLPETIGKTEY